MRCIKRAFYLFFCVFLISTTALCQNKKPNIIFILTDDQRGEALGVDRGAKGRGVLEGVLDLDASHND